MADAIVIPSFQAIARRIQSSPPPRRRRRIDEVGGPSARDDPAPPRAPSAAELLSLQPPCILTAAERAAFRVPALEDAKFPSELASERDFEALTSAVTLATHYIDAVFYCATGRTPPFSARAADRPRDEAERRSLVADMVGLSSALTGFWLSQGEQAKSELDLSADDASSERIPAGLVVMSAAGLADATAYALGAFDDLRGVTALSFPSVRNQLIAQNAKRILDYCPSEVVSALEVATHSWDRLRVDEQILEYVRALRLRFGILERCALPHSRLSADDVRYVTEPSNDGRGLCAVSAAFKSVVIHRLRTFEFARWIRRTYAPQWTVEELRTELGMSADVDPRKGTLAVATFLRDYAAHVAGKSSIEDEYRTRYIEMMLGPGDTEAFEARNPNVKGTTKIVVRASRGRKFFVCASARSIAKPDAELGKLVARLEAAADAFPSRLNARSTATLSEELAGMCAFDCLLTGRFNVPWRDRFLVTRGIYRVAVELGFFDEGSLPAILVSANTYDLVWNRRLFRASSVFEAFAWWLHILRCRHDSCLPARISRFKGVVAAKLQQDADEMEPTAEGEGAPDDAVSELCRNITVVDMKDLCRIPVDGPGAMNLRLEGREQLTVLSDVDRGIDNVTYSY